MQGALRKKQLTVSSVEHFQKNHENKTCNIQFGDHKHIFQIQTYPSNNMAIISPICLDNRQQNEPPRRNPFRNQIDYILVRSNTLQKPLTQKPLFYLQQIRIISLSLQKSWSNGNINQKLKAATNVSTYIIRKASETNTRVRSNHI